MRLTVVVVLFPVFVVVVFIVLVLCSTGVRPLEAVEQEDGCREELPSHLVDHLRPVLQVDQGTKSENAHLPVVEAVRGKQSQRLSPTGGVKQEVEVSGCQWWQLLPEEAVDVFEPLGDEVVSDGLGVVGEAQVLQSVEEERGAVVERGDGHLQAHGPQLAGLHLPRQALQRSGDEQWHNLQDTDTSHLEELS